LKKKQKASQTALKVGLNIIALQHVDKMKDILPEGIVEATYQLLSASGATSQKRLNKHLSPEIVSLYKKFDWILPGQFEVFGFRKAFFEECVLKALSDGVEQVLVLGAGFDTLCYRLCRNFPNVNFFEIDNPQTALSKIKGIKKLGESNNHFIIPEDLSMKALSDVLGNNSFWNPNSKTIITAEGLLQYLPQNSVQELFKQCNQITGNESKITFTYIGKGPDGRPYAGPKTGLMLWLLKVTGEPWLWSTNMDELIILLSDCGWEYAYDLIGENYKRGIEYFGCARKI
jgi:methyltransferase (TIGR00027 family)